MTWLFKYFKESLPETRGNFRPKLPSRAFFKIELIFSLLFLTIFLLVTWNVLINGFLIQWDQKILKTVVSWRHKGLTIFFLFFTYLASRLGVVISGIFLGIYAFLKHKKRIFYLPLVSLIGSEIINLIIKALIQRPRPNPLFALAPAHGYAFPSGHTLISVTFYGLIGLLFYFSIKKRIWRSLILACTLLTMILVGLSRIYVGVHWASDVFGGWTLGIFLLSLFLLFSKNKDYLHINLTNENK